MSGTTQASTSSRPRNQVRKKVNDDAAYFGPPSSVAGPSSFKRPAGEKADGEHRAKRKRMEPSTSAGSGNKKDMLETEPRKSLVEFHKMSTTMLYRYMIQFDIVPGVHPSPLTADDPPAPTSLADSPHFPSRPPTPALTPANRPRRDLKESQNRRRSSRLLEEEPRTRTPVLSDVAEVHGVLAKIVERHFREMAPINGREEVDTLAAFMCAVEKSKGGKS